MADQAERGSEPRKRSPTPEEKVRWWLRVVGAARVIEPTKGVSLSFGPDGECAALSGVQMPRCKTFSVSPAVRPVLKVSETVVRKVRASMVGTIPGRRRPLEREQHQALDSSRMPAA